jgi:hypothetical protein
MPYWLVRDLKRLAFGLAVIAAFAVIACIVFGIIALMINVPWTGWVIGGIIVLALAWHIGKYTV